jgi:nicotinamide-nucleotide amidase
VALTDGANTWVRKMEFGGRLQRRDRIRTLAANYALDMVRRYLTGLNPEKF